MNDDDDDYDGKFLLRNNSNLHAQINLQCMDRSIFHYYNLYICTS